jgi:hypothetical protein
MIRGYWAAVYVRARIEAAEWVQAKLGPPVGLTLLTLGSAAVLTTAGYLTELRPLFWAAVGSLAITALFWLLILLRRMTEIPARWHNAQSSENSRLKARLAAATDVTAHDEERRKQQRSKIEEYERVFASGTTLYGRTLSSNDEYNKWIEEYDAWLKDAEEVVKRCEGHLSLLHFKRAPFVSMTWPHHEEHAFNRDHASRLAVLDVKLESLNKDLAAAKDGLGC